MSGINRLFHIGGSDRVTAGQMPVLATASGLPNIPVKAVTLRADPANLINIMVGDSTVTTTTGFILEPGDAVSLNISNLNAIFVVASTTGAALTWLGEGL